MKKLILKSESKLVLLLLIVAGVMSSCKHYLDLTPKDQVTDATLWATTGNADLFLNNLYGVTYTPYRGENPEENRTDNSMGKPSSGNAAVKQSTYTPSSNAPSYWGQYSNIRSANLFIEKVGASKLPDAYKKLRIAEARFLRAYYYHLLWTHHGGVPIITDILNITEQGDAVFRARNTDAETEKFIVDELAAAANDLPVKAADKNRATKGAALTLKAWVELYNASPLKNPANDKAKWATAAATNKQVMDLGVYSLFPDYETLFYEANNNSSESIFEHAHIGGISSIGSSREGHWGTFKVGGLQRAWCGVNPSQNMVDAYRMANGKSITDAGSGYDDQNPYVGREKRFYQSYVYDGSLWLGVEMVAKQGLGSDNQTDLTNSGDASNTGYYVRKSLEERNAVNGPNNLSGANYMIFRYAEVLLSYAEAQNEAVGPDASVYDAINKVRVRSSLPQLAAGLTQAQMRTEIANERRVELFFEDKRWYDLMRTKTAEVLLNQPIKAISINLVGGKWVYKTVDAAQGKQAFFPAKNYLYPIPQTAIDRNSKLTQNPGY
jgi:hypothetical protein